MELVYVYVPEIKSHPGRVAFVQKSQLKDQKFNGEIFTTLESGQLTE